MKKFIALYYNTSGAHQSPPDLTEEQKEQMLAPWGAWAQKYGERLLDMGSPIAPASMSGSGDSWSPSKNFVTGYSLVAADSLAEAKKMFEGHPIYMHPNHAVEISECVPV